jgi:hypothetical protein
METNRGGKTQRLNLLISQAFKEQLISAAKKRGISKSSFVRQAVKREFGREKELELEMVARELAPLYDGDPDLTAFTELDGEDFI